MENSPTWIAVAALALFDDAGRVLLQQRPPRKHHGGAWEFPGGKVEAGEIPRLALLREIAEELALELDPHALSPALVAEEGAGPQIVLILYTATRWSGQPEAREGQKWGWFDPAEALALPLAPLDRDLAVRLLT